MSTGFQFGLPSTTSSGGSTGFSFGTTGFGSSTGSAQTTATSLPGLSTAASGSSVFPSLGLSLSSPFASASTTTSVPQTTAASLGLSFQTTKPGLVFGTAATQPSTSGSSTPTSFMFGAPVSQQASLAAPVSTQGASTAAGSLGGFSFGLQTAKTPGFGQSTSVSSALPSFGASSFIHSGTTTSAPLPSFGALSGTTSTVTGLSSTPSQAPLGIFSQPSTSASSLFKAVTSTVPAVPSAPITSVGSISQTLAGSVTQASTSSVSLGFTLPSAIPSTTDASKPAIGPLFGKTEASALKITPTTSTTLAPVPTVGGTSVLGLPTVSSTTTATTSAPTSQTTTSVASVTKPSTLTFHQLEELVNKWAHELEDQERYFMDEAERISQWDQALMSNGEKITTLYEKVDACKQEQAQLEQELDFIDGHQKELEKLLETLERTAEELPPGQLHSDFERESIFQLATNVDLELGQLLSDLREMADQVNSATSKVSGGAALARNTHDVKAKDGGLSKILGGAGQPEEGIGAMHQVTRILNCHMHSLNWIHQNTHESQDVGAVASFAAGPEMRAWTYLTVMMNSDRLSESKPAPLPTQASRRLHCHQSAVRAARFNSDGQYCVTAGGDKTIKLWNPYKDRLLKTYTGHGGEVSDAQLPVSFRTSNVCKVRKTVVYIVSPNPNLTTFPEQANSDNSQLGSGGADCLVVLWDVGTGQSVRRWRRHAGRVNAVRFAAPFQHSESSLPSPILISAGVDGMVLVWDARAKTPYPVQTMHEAKDSVTCVAFSRWQIITGSVDKCVRIYDIRRGEMTEDYVGYPVTSVSMTMDCQCLLVGTQDSTLRLFDALNGELLNKYTGHVNKTYRMDSVLMNNDAHVASGSEAHSLVYIWDFVRSNYPLLTLDHSPGGPMWGGLSSDDEPVSQLAIEAAKSANFLIHSLSPHPTQSRLLTAGGDFVWLWDAEPDVCEDVDVD
ncbi:hypothetical protein T265_10694 [Opisthorchis viverrini]|uniref:WD repeat domain-containing protein 83 n=1 Tax=Opisthorchis viverrini TaxID=6198 RepID=A0A075A099_OPIVI|nr:hypothetical protein T265_10694 [Opisthorchis viverrini]KER20849.1 hypothetical protein T265_10694 [Opisthorchis viverrini]